MTSYKVITKIDGKTQEIKTFCGLPLSGTYFEARNVLAFILKSVRKQGVKVVSYHSGEKMKLTRYRYGMKYITHNPDNGQRGEMKLIRTD